MDYISRELPRRFQKPTLFQCTHEQTSKQRRSNADSPTGVSLRRSDVKKPVLI